MSGVFAGAMTTIMALVLFSTVIPLGGVNPLLLAPGFAMTVLLAGASAGRGFVSKQGAWKNSPLNWAVL